MTQLSAAACVYNSNYFSFTVTCIMIITSALWLLLYLLNTITVQLSIFSTLFTLYSN